MNEEIWKDVVGYEGVYSVSSLGRVRRDVRGGAAVPGRILRASPLRRGHLIVSLYGGSGPKKPYVHRLVACAFLGPPPSSRHEVAHNDGNPSNNHASNLRWATHADNMSDMIAHGTSTRGSRQRMAKLTDADVRAIRMRYAAGGVTQKDLAREFGVMRQTVSKVVTRFSWGWLGAA